MGHIKKKIRVAFKRKKNMRGSITVYMVFSFFIFSSFLGCLIDLARYRISYSFMKRATQDALEAEYSNYCRELFEQYHLLLYYPTEKQQDNIKEYINDSLLYVNKENKRTTSGKVLGIAVSQVEFQEFKILDYGIKLTEIQILQYMKQTKGINKLQSDYNSFLKLFTNSSLLKIKTNLGQHFYLGSSLKSAKQATFIKKEGGDQDNILNKIGQIIPDNLTQFILDSDKELSDKEIEISSFSRKNNLVNEGEFLLDQKNMKR